MKLSREQSAKQGEGEISTTSPPGNVARLSRARFIADAWKLEGLPFKHQGRSAETGLDCIYVPIFLFELQGYVLPEEIPSTYRRDVHDYKRIERVLHTYCPPVELKEARAGDLYLFKPSLVTRHIGVRLTDDDPPLVLQPSSQPRPDFPEGQITVEPFSDRWVRMFRGCFRPPFTDD